MLSLSISLLACVPESKSSAYEKGTFTTQTTAVKTAVDNVWNRQKDMIDAIDEMDKIMKEWSVIP